MSVLDLILSENEKKLWQGEVSKEGLKRIIAKLLLLFLSIVLSYIILILIYFFSNLFSFLVSLPFVLVYGGVAGFFIFRYILYYSELKGLEYYITDQKEFDLTTSKEMFCCYESQSLHFNNIDEIIIYPLRLTKKNLAHIDFYSKYIIANHEEVYVNINITKNEITPYDTWRNSQDLKKHRFWYVKDYQKVEEILRQIVPDKVQIEKW
ncbi:MAG: hypothetical protein ACFE9T_10345 [Promethearchaeota archaeon]